MKPLLGAVARGQVNLAAWGRAAGANSRVRQAELSAQPAIHVDPYTLWGLYSNFRAFGRQTLPELDFAVELVGAWDRDAFVAGLPPGVAPNNLVVPAMYNEPLVGGKTRSKFVTVGIRVPNPKLESDDDWKKLDELVLALFSHPLVKRAQVGFPVTSEVIEDAALSSPVGAPAASSAGADDQILLAVADDFIPFAHRALRDEVGNTRVRALWDQSDHLRSRVSEAPLKDQPWGPTPGFGNGAQASQADLNKVIAKHTQAGSTCDEAALYQDTRALPDHPPPKRQGHGAAVAGLLAGNAGHMPKPWGTPDVGAGALINTPQLASAPIVVVQWPFEQSSVANGRWLAVHVMDALRYMVHQSHRDGAAPVPMVMNISYGGLVGPHDGSSILERAMDEVIAAHPNLQVVLASGNFRGTGRNSHSADPLQHVPVGIHGEWLLYPNQSEQLHLLVPPGKDAETFLELWFSERGNGGATTAAVLDPDELSLTLGAPGGQGPNGYAPPPEQPLLGAQATEDVAQLAAPLQNATHGLFVVARASQSENRSMGLLVVAPTAPSDGLVAAPAGVWTLTVKNKGPRTLVLNARVERDVLSSRPSSRVQQARLIADRLAFQAAARQPTRRPTVRGSKGGVTDDQVMSGMANGVGALAAGALVANPHRVSAYSSSRNADGGGLLAYAVADASLTLPGIRVCGNYSGTVVRLNGTSIAAPQVARHDAASVKAASFFTKR